MKRHPWLGLLAIVVALALASCAPSDGGSQGNGGGTDHGGGSDETTGTRSSEEGSEDEASRRLVMERGRYSDRAFIDAMVPHHQGAVDMARVALENAEHPEIRTLAEGIVATQEAEIERLKSIKRDEFGTSEVPMRMDASEMEAMGMAEGEDLAEADPFDRAFIDAMIPHHRSAIAMAEVAHEETGVPEVRSLAEEIVEAQTREISQMNAWREEWYPEG